MSQLKMPNPSISEIIAADAYEARMHFLKPDGGQFGSYHTWPGMVSEPTVEAAQKELPFREYPGLLMWVDFKEVGIKRGISNQMGRIAIATYPNELECYEEVLKSPQENSFIKLWLGRYAMDRTRNFFGDHRHPLWDVSGLYAKLDIRGGLDEVGRRAKQEKWDPRIDKKQWYVASLARKAKEDFPELFKGDDSWHKSMGIKLKHKSLPRPAK